MVVCLTPHPSEHFHDSALHSQKSCFETRKDYAAKSERQMAADQACTLPNPNSNHKTPGHFCIWVEGGPACFADRTGFRVPALVCLRA